MTDDERMVPVFLKPSKDRRIVVFGGGKVAYRKCRQFKGFDITVVAEDTVDEISDVADRVILAEVVPEEVPEYLDGAFIVVAATNSKELNDAIREEASKYGVLVNSAHGGGDVLLPSSVRKRNFTVAVSSEGAAAAFPPYVAKKIDSYLGPEYEDMLDLLSELRKDLKSEISTQPKRAEYLAEVLDTEHIWELLKAGDKDGAKAEASALMSKYQRRRFS
jgi:siroheme synthase-like protein